eukprot:TRINITY_DN2397_c0_g1_i1.p1 TRINITY_DN2397_c0_g1~~TRINITY_DN2397_c0_g1_i1.p1  ORF type:complete len:234 (+),score=75.61 TRINITY_DN2397_c0_g1_i1:79-702(+)
MASPSSSSPSTLCSSSSVSSSALSSSMSSASSATVVSAQSPSLLSLFARLTSSSSSASASTSSSSSSTPSSSASTLSSSVAASSSSGPSTTSTQTQTPITLEQQVRDMFAKLTQYMKGEIDVSMEDYRLLEQLNLIAGNKYKDMADKAEEFVVVVDSIAAKYNALKPFLSQIDDLDTKTGHLEQVVKQLDTYTEQLDGQFRKLCNSL